MTRGLRRRLLVLGIMCLVGCSSVDGKTIAPEPVKSIDAARFYNGRWYEIGRTPMKLTDGCVAGTTDYFRRDDGELIDRDACRMNSPDGTEKVYQGPVTILNAGINTKVSVRYMVWGFYPVWRTYWMIDHGDDYDWFIVSDPAFENVSLFTRGARPTAEMVRLLTDRAQALGYDTTKLEFPMQFPVGP
jgi:apolipoprotein D and lipocalin family protein